MAGRTNAPDVTQVLAVAYGNGRFVAVVDPYGSRSPGIVWSADGLVWNWSANIRGPFGDDIRFLAGAFYLTAGNVILRSVDGQNWERHADGFSVPLTLMATDGRGLLVGVRPALSLRLFLSVDRSNFRETAPLPVAPGPAALIRVELSALAFVNGRYFAKYTAFFANSQSRDFFAWTTDGASWTTVSALDSSIYLASGDGRMVAGGSFTFAWTSLASTDGINFTRSGGQPQFYPGKLGYAGGRFFFIGSFTASADGLNWAPIAPAPATNSPPQMFSIAYGNGRYVAVGYEFSTPGPGLRELVATLTAPATPVIAVMAADRTVTEGNPTTFTVAVEGATANLTYQWRRDGLALSGATGATYNIAAVRPSDAGRYTVDVRNSLGTTISDVAFLTVAPPVVAPTISEPPVGISRVAGQSALFAVTVGGTAPFSYQWFRNGAAIAGATNATLTLGTVTVAEAGDYSVVASNAAGSATSVAATLVVREITRISNLSVLTSLPPGGDFTLGYVVGVGGTGGPKLVVLRAVGPSLGALGVPGALDDPSLETFAGAAKTGENDDWGGSPTLASVFSSVGAFPLNAPLSRDAAVATTISARENSVRIRAGSGGGGMVLAEVYDATPTATFTNITPRFLNVSVLKSIGAGVTVGFTLAGAEPKTVLIRAVGPTLGGFGVANGIADPRLALFRANSGKINENDDWGGAAGLAAAFQSVGAFALPAGSKDAALMATLVPGGYTVEVNGGGGPSGVALVEVYEVP